MVSYCRPWFDAWLESAYGADGFWRHNDPHDHFRTAAGVGGQLAGAVEAWLDRTPQIECVVEIGAGDGDLLAGLAGSGPDLRVVGVDLRTRPAGLPPRVEWVVDEWDVRHDVWTGGAVPRLFAELTGPVLVVCCEWLDDLPGLVVGAGSDGWHELLVDTDGTEHVGRRIGDGELAWADTWWPLGPSGSTRAELGLTRDRAWSDLLRRIEPLGGGALLIDYGHLSGSRPEHGSLAGYRDGRRVPPLPSPEVNLTASVAVDSVRAAGERLGAETALWGRQSEVLSELLPAAAHRDPLVDLVHRSQRSALSADAVWGSQWWLLQTYPLRARAPG